MNFKSFIVISAMMTALANCANIKRYHSVQEKTCALGEIDGICSQVIVRLSVSSRAPVAGAPRTIFDLDGEGEAAAIQAISTAGRLSSNDLRAALAAPVRAPTAPNLSTVQRLVTFGVAPESVGLRNIANRIDQIDSRLTLGTEAGYRFRELGNVENEFQTVNFGSTTLQRQLSASLNVGPAGAAPIPASGSVTTGIIGTVNRNVTRRVPTLAPFFDEDEIKLLQIGDEGLPLGGQTRIQLELQSTAKSFDNIRQYTLSGLTGESTQPQSVTMTQRPTRVPVGFCKEVTASLRVNLLTRVVDTGENTVLENDDAATYVTSVVEVDDVTLIPLSAFKIESWRLLSRESKIPVSIRIRGRPSGQETLNLATFDAAERLLGWLQGRNGSGNLGNAVLTLDDRPLTRAIAGGLTIGTGIANPYCDGSPS